MLVACGQTRALFPNEFTLKVTLVVKAETQPEACRRIEKILTGLVDDALAKYTPGFGYPYGAVLGFEISAEGGREQ